MNQGDLYISVKDILGNNRSKIIGRNFLLSKTSVNTIGRSRKNYIHISDESISKNHAVLRRLNDFQFQIEDLGSKHGTYVNNKKVYPKILDDMNELNERIENISKRFEAIDTLDQKLNIENKKYKAMKKWTKDLYLAKKSSIDNMKVDVGSNIRLGRVIFSIETANTIEGTSLDSPEIMENKDHSYIYRDQVNSNDLLEAIEVNKTVIETNKIFKRFHILISTISI
jgi:pSer/pThr/pTyr-binding forkhead associated (FHA) protein